jgi:hypothetical protein
VYFILRQLLKLDLLVLQERGVLFIQGCNPIAGRPKAFIAASPLLRSAPLVLLRAFAKFADAMIPDQVTITA